MSEDAMWDTLRPVLVGAKLDPVRVENTVGSGTPDVNYTEGWIELKFAKYWPKREATPLRLDHFVPEQRAWLTKRRKAGGKAFVLLKVGSDEWLLFEGLCAALYLGYEPKERLYDLVIARWTRKPTTGEMKQCLQG